jgi:hypothetical protein
VRFTDGHRGLDGRDPGDESEPSCDAAEVDAEAEAVLPEVAGDEGEQDEPRVDGCEDMTENEACLAECEKGEVAGARLRGLGDFESLGNGQGCEQEVEAIAAGFDVLVDDYEAGKQRKGDAEKGGPCGESATPLRCFPAS